MSAFFSVDPEDPVIGLAKGAQWDHNMAGEAYLLNKYTGTKGHIEWPEQFKAAANTRLRPFTSGGVMMANGRIFMAGPSDDVDGDKQLGMQRPEARIPRVDQGLYLWACDYVAEV